MLNVLGVVQMRAGDDGGPPSAWRFGGRALVEHIVRRLSESQLLDGLLVVHGPEHDADAVRAMVPPDVPVLVADRRDEIGQLVDVVARRRPESIVRVWSDFPLVDPELVDRLIATSRDHESCDYITYCSHDGRPAVLSPVGVFAEWCRATALERAEQSCGNEEQRCATSLFCGRPDLFNLRFVPAPPQLDRDDLRFTVSRPEDCENMHTLFEALGPDLMDWRHVAALLDRHPDVRRRMAEMNRELARA